MFVVLANYSGATSGTGVILVTGDMVEALKAARLAQTKHGYFFYSNGSGTKIHRIPLNTVCPAGHMGSQKIFERVQTIVGWREWWFDSELEKEFGEKSELSAHQAHQ